MGRGLNAGSGTWTVLFTDVVGSTALRSSVGDVAADDVRREHDRLLVAAVDAHRGVVVKALGDGVMAAFEGAADGVACAVAMQQAIDRFSRRRDADLAIRVGLSAGDVSVEDGDWFGTPVVEAARLEAAAQGGQILVADLVRLLAGTRTDVTFEPLEPLTLKGLPNPVAACAIAWEPLSGAGPLPLPALLRASGFGFVGRDAEQKALRGAWESATGGARGCVMVGGEPGIGKTRLAAELAVEVHAAGAIVLAGRCDEDLAVPYQPFVEALRFFIDQAPDDLVDRGLGRFPGELVRLIPELAERVPGLARAPARRSGDRALPVVRRGVVVAGGGLQGGSACPRARRSALGHQADRVVAASRAADR